MLNIEKARRVLGWCPTYSTDEAIFETVNWYRHFYEKDVDMYDFTIEQIKNFEEKL